MKAGAAFALSLMVAAMAQAAPPPADPQASPASVPHPKRHGVHHRHEASRVQVGKASIYARRLSGRKTADGSRLDPRSDTAASKTLPLGTTARVTNLATGDSTVVTIRDRGPYVRGRVVDLTPAAADQIGLDRKQGVARVAVEPIAPPEGGAGRSQAAAAK